MGAKYSILKFVAVAGTIFSVYNAVTDQMLLEDIAIIVLVAGALVAIEAESRQKHKAKEPGEDSVKKHLEELEELGEELHKKLVEAQATIG